MHRIGDKVVYRPKFKTKKCNILELGKTYIIHDYRYNAEDVEQRYTFQVIDENSLYGWYEYYDLISIKKERKIKLNRINERR